MTGMSKFTKKLHILATTYENLSEMVPYLEIRKHYNLIFQGTLGYCSETSTLSLAGSSSFISGESLGKLQQEALRCPFLLTKGSYNEKTILKETIKSNT